MKRVAIYLIQIYRAMISPFLRARCKFYPSCSLYAQIALERHGLLKGSWLFIKRLAKCHPWYQGNSDDPVPTSTTQVNKQAEEQQYVR